VKSSENKVDLKNTLFIVSSKSGSTLEPNVFKQYFFERIQQLVGPEEAGSRFLAITDPGSKMQHVAERDGFRRVFSGWPNIGGRYSVLSDFGLFPAAIMGVDVAKFLDRTEVFLQITCDDASDLPVPGRKCSFGVVKAAQARGDFDVLAQRGRRALRAHIVADVATGLNTLRAGLRAALGS
jgi:Phosphoglucose isomerase